MKTTSWNKSITIAMNKSLMKANRFLKMNPLNNQILKKTYLEIQKRKYKRSVKSVRNFKFKKMKVSKKVEKNNDLTIIRKPT